MIAVLLIATHAILKNSPPQAKKKGIFDNNYTDSLHNTTVLSVGILFTERINIKILCHSDRLCDCVQIYNALVFLMLF